MKKWIKIASWVLFLSGVSFVLISAKHLEERQTLLEPEIDLKVQNGIALITEEEILKELKFNRLFWKGMKKEELEVSKIEKFLVGLNEVESAEVFVELGAEWKIKIRSRLPIARVVLNNRSDFYLDSRRKVMNISEYSKPKILTFTGLEGVFNHQVSLNEIINNDSLITKFKLDQIYRISRYVCNDAFYDAQIVQVHYDSKEGFILVPRVGRHDIIFGSANSEEEVKAKFNKLTTFYEDVIPYEGWDKYKSINLKFENQIVAKKK
ncbi:MAG: hypothetical protein R3277_10035 [Brumimicrobium sp.]|nr:hypothetical protein [Brumimicrobium sp.]